MEASESATKHLALICVVALCLIAIVAAYVATTIFASSAWVDKKELIGLKLGMPQHQVLAILGSVGVQDVLPELAMRLTINRNNIAQIDRLKSAPGVCVTSNKDGINLIVSFNEAGDITKFSYGSVKRFNDLSDSRSTNDFVSQLRTMILNIDGLVAFPCIPDNRWVRISKATIEDISYLSRYDVWTFDEPSSYSGVRLKFSSGRISKIEYRKQPSELP